MLFYTVGELFQDAALNRAKRSIKALLEIQATEVGVLRDGQRLVLDPKAVAVGDVIEVRPGEKVALDGTLLSARATFNTAALTGESVPQTKQQGDVVLAGMINQDTLSQITVTAGYQDTKLSKILAIGAGRRGPQGQNPAVHHQVCPHLHAHCGGPGRAAHAAALLLRGRLRVPRLALPGAGVSGHFLPLRAGYQHSAGLLRRHRGGLQGGRALQGLQFPGRDARD